MPARSLPPRSNAETTELRTAVESLLPELRRRAFMLTKNRIFAEDLVQDAVERALRFESTYATGSNPRAWLRCVLMSVFVSRRRRALRERRALELVATDPCGWFAADAAPSMRDLSPRVARALASIATPFRCTIELVDLAELSYRDAAERLGVPVGTVMSRLHRGRKMLAAALREDGATPRPTVVSRAA